MGQRYTKSIWQMLGQRQVNWSGGQARAYAWQVRHCGLTFGGEFGDVPMLGVLRGSVEGGKSQRAIGKVDPLIIEGNAPRELMAACDATWNRLTPEGEVVDVCAFALTHRGAAIMVELKNIGATGSSAAAEGLGILKTTDKIIRARDVYGALGTPILGPTLLISDSDPALRTAAGESTATRMRHELRRLAIVTQRVRGLRRGPVLHERKVAQVLEAGELRRYRPGVHEHGCDHGRDEHVSASGFHQRLQKQSLRDADSG